MPNDTVSLAMHQAAERFGGGDGTFNSANFSNAFMRVANLKGALDGHSVAVVLSGRSDVKRLSGGSHWQIVWSAHG